MKGAEEATQLAADEVIVRGTMKWFDPVRGYGFMVPSAGDGADVLVIFRGNESYISPNWYPSKHETHRQVPTWNYEVVHAHGKLTVHEDENFIRSHVEHLTKTHEANEPKPWKMSDAPKDYMDIMLKAIVGIQITLTSIEGKAKLSQNRELRDKLGAIDALENLGNSKMANAMKKFTKK